MLQAILPLTARKRKVEGAEAARAAEHGQPDTQGGRHEPGGAFQADFCIASFQLLRVNQPFCERRRATTQAREGSLREKTKRNEEHLAMDGKKQIKIKPKNGSGGKDEGIYGGRGEGGRLVKMGRTHTYKIEHLQFEKRIS